MKYLKKLKIIGNKKYIKIPKEITQLVLLEKIVLLDMDGCILPKTLVKLPNLKKLVLPKRFYSHISLVKNKDLIHYSDNMGQELLFSDEETKQNIIKMFFILSQRNCKIILQ